MTETSGSDENPATARAIRDGIDDAYAKASKAAHTAVERTKDGLEQARSSMTGAYSSGREKPPEAYSSARGRAAEGFENNPLAALLGGIAIGAAIGALLPRTEREA